MKRSTSLPTPFGAQRGPGEARRHGEEVDDAAIARREDGGHLGVGHVDAREGHVGLAPAGRVEHRRAHGDRVARVGRDDRVAEPERARARRPRAGSPRPRRCTRSAPPRRRASADAEDAALAARAEDDDHVPRAPRAARPAAPRPRRRAPRARGARAGRPAAWRRRRSRRGRPRRRRRSARSPAGPPGRGRCAAA